NSLEIIKEKSENSNALEVFTKAVENVRPLLEVKARRIGGATYQVPIEVKPQRGIFLALLWLKKFARAKKGRPMEERLAEEILNAYKKEGPAIKKREDTHKMAEANKAFSHYRW
ncbi:MAG: 30S ribosomal protein S7, partial [Candidatus Omnitrophica bacterium]|nr:30S ribosomal protein S7 [Candidatus Omnitrophota bacterium]